MKQVQFEYLSKLDEEKIEALSSFELQHFKWAWSKKVWLELSKSSRDIICLWQVENDQGLEQIISLCVFELSSPDLCHLYKIVVDERYRRKKIAKSLYDHMCRSASFALGIRDPQIYLEVEEGNDGAIGFYQKVGLKQIHIKKRFYQNGHSAVIMQGVYDCDKP